MKNNHNNVSRETIENNVSATFDAVANRVHYDAEGISEKTTKKGAVAVQKKYDFVAKLGNRVSMTISDPAIIQSVEKIRMAEQGKKVMGYVVCKEMANIADSGKLEKMGFKNISEFGRAMFGYQTSTSNHYARIGRNFITDDYRVIDGLPELTISHFIELNKYVGENGDVSDIIDMYLDGTLVDGMSTKDVRKALLSKDKEIEVEGEVLDDEDNTSPDATTENKEDKTTDSSKGKKEKASQLADSTLPFDANIECGKALDAIAKFAEAMATLNANGVQVSGYEDKLATLADLVKAIIQ